MKKYRLILFLSLPLLLAPIAPAAPTTSPATNPAQANDAEATAMVKAVKGSLPIRIDGEGVFEPVEASEIRLKTKVYSGEMAIKSIVATGTRVKAGDSLLEIDDKPIKKEIAAAENDLESARANLAKSQSDFDLMQQADDQAIKVAQDDVKNATDALKWFDEIDGPQMLQQGELSVKQAQFALDDQNDELDQLRKMYKTEDLTSATADIVIKRALRQVELTKVGLKREQDQNRKLKATTFPEARLRLKFAVDQQNNSLNQQMAAHAQSAVQRKTALASAKQNAADAEQKLADLQADAKLFHQTSPSDGVVYFGQFASKAWSNNDAKSFAVGEKVPANSVLLTVLKPGKLRVAMDLPEAKYTAAKAGMTATVVPIATDETMTGKALPPSPITKSGGLELLIELPDANPILLPGMKASIFIDAGKADGILLVPTASIADSKVWVKGEDGKPMAKHVITGRTADDQTEIIDGLSDGDEIFEQPQK